MADQSTAEGSAEEVEGLDSGSSGGWGDYPLDSVFVRQETRTVSEALNRIEKGRYVLDPDFQREFVWPEDKQSKLIESCVMRIPLPVFYVAEAKDGRIIVVDGLQRLTTFARYVGDRFRLRGLESSYDGAPTAHLEGKLFTDLPINLQERILDTQLIMYILDAKAPERAKLDIFERVNSGVPLSRQQMRNALYSGAATNWLKDVASTPLFRDVTGGSLNPKTMRDREAINRFCAFTLLGWNSYKGDMDNFLGEALQKMEEINTSSLMALRASFERALQSSKNLFGVHAFRKSLIEDDQYVRRSILNMALFEVTTVSFAKMPGVVSLNDSLGKALHDSFIELVEDPDFSLAITYSTNSTRSVQFRFDMAEEAIAQAELMS